MLICGPKYNIIIKCSAFVHVKQFFLSDSFSFDLQTESYFSNLLLEAQLLLATAESP
jgi:hypothetical protein